MKNYHIKKPQYEGQNLDKVPFLCNTINVEYQYDGKKDGACKSPCRKWQLYAS